MTIITNGTKEAIERTYFVLTKTDYLVDRLSPERLLGSLGYQDKKIIFDTLQVSALKDLEINKVFSILYLLGYEVEA